MRSLAAFLSQVEADVVALNGIEAGDALATATRFDFQWAYRGRQALLWSRRVVAKEVHDVYLPSATLRPFERRGLLRVDALHEDAPLHVFAAACAPDRSGISDLRFTRAMLRSSHDDVLLLATMPHTRIGFGDLRMQTVSDGGDLAIAAGGYELTQPETIEAQDGLGPALVARASRVDVAR